MAFECLLADMHPVCRDSWPDSYWDDWIRLNSTRRGRQCIRPEICRNFNFGEKGSSKGFFYRRFLKPIRLNDQDIDWMQQDLSYLAPDRSRVSLNLCCFHPSSPHPGHANRLAERKIVCGCLCNSGVVAWSQEVPSCHASQTVVAAAPKAAVKIKSFS